jgi:hypothetical protein
VSLSAQTSTLLKKGAAARLSIFGVNPAGHPQLARMEDVTDQTKTFTCYFSSSKVAEQLQPGLFFKDVFDVVLRVAKSEQNFNPTVGKKILLLAANEDGSDFRVEIADRLTSAINPEWIVACKNVL